MPRGSVWTAAAQCVFCCRVLQLVRSRSPSLPHPFCCHRCSRRQTFISRHWHLKVIKCKSERNQISPSTFTVFCPISEPWSPTWDLGLSPGAQRYLYPALNSSCASRARVSIIEICLSEMKRQPCLSGGSRPKLCPRLEKRFTQPGSRLNEGNKMRNEKFYKLLI